MAYVLMTDPPGIRWVRIDRASGKAVFGVFPTQEDPNSPVIWEAFQPQTEPRRSYTASTGDPYNQQQQQQRLLQAARRQATSTDGGNATEQQANGLPTENTL